MDEFFDYLIKRDNMFYDFTEIWKLDFVFVQNLKYRKKVLLYKMYLQNEFDFYCVEVGDELDYLIYYKNELQEFFIRFEQRYLNGIERENDIERLDALYQHYKDVVNYILKLNKSFKGIKII